MRNLLLLVVIILLVILVPPMLRGWRRPASAPRTQHDELVKDPVCHTYVLLSRAVTTELDGVVTRFCSPECAARFAEGRPRR
jgi:YHS domain-containing protein